MLIPLISEVLLDVGYRIIIQEKNKKFVTCTPYYVATGITRFVVLFWSRTQERIAHDREDIERQRKILAKKKPPPPGSAKVPKAAAKEDGFVRPQDPDKRLYVLISLVCPPAHMNILLILSHWGIQLFANSAILQTHFNRSSLRSVEIQWENEMDREGWGITGGYLAHGYGSPIKVCKIFFRSVSLFISWLDSKSRWASVYVKMHVWAHICLAQWAEMHHFPSICLWLD